MYRYYNPHPKGLLTDDCVKRAIVVVTGKSYEAVQRELNAYKKISGAETFNSAKNLCYVEDRLGAEKIIPEESLTAETFCREYPRGRYILAMEEHWSACVDGVIYDVWDCSGNLVNAVYVFRGDNYRAPDLMRQVFRYCCTSEEISETETRIRIYDGNGVFSERIIPSELTKGYILCLRDSNYTYIPL